MTVIIDPDLQERARKFSSNGQHDSNENAQASSELMTYSYGELLDLDLPPERPLIAGLMGEQTGNIWGGPGGVGKSWLMMAAARAIASGTPFLGHFPTTQHDVLVIDEENRLRTLVNRARMFERADPLGQDLPITFVSLQGLRIDTPFELAQVHDLLTRYRPGLAILDSLTRVHTANENSSNEMAAVFSSAKGLMRAHQCSVLFADHTRKKGLINDAGETLRGSSEKRAWPETILDIAADAEKRGGLIISMPKSREDEAHKPFSVTLDIDKQASTARLTYNGEQAGSSITKANDLIAGIHSLHEQLGPDGCDASTLSLWLDCSADTVRRHAGKLVKAGILATRTVVPSAKGGKPKTVYDVIGGRD